MHLKHGVICNGGCCYFLSEECTGENISEINQYLAKIRTTFGAINHMI